MNGVEDKLEELIDVINRAMRYGNSPYTNPTTSGTRKKQPSMSEDGRFDRSKSTYHKSINQFATVIKTAHGGVDDFAHALSHAVRGFVELELAVNAFSAMLNIGKTFSKMTDVGQNFNGSMFAMMQQVGQAGLSLDQFSTLMSRNSRATAAIGVKSMSSLQLSVRNNLEQFGFYGMALDDVTNATSDYMETLREAGTINAFSAFQQKTAVIGLISQASGLAKVFGTSREEIIKHTNEIMRQTQMQSRLGISTVGQTEAAQKMITLFSAQSEQLATMAGEQFGKGGYVDTSLGKALISSGMGRVNEIIEQKALTPVRAGRSADADTGLKIAEQFDNTTMNNLLTLSKISPEAEQTLKFANEIRASMAKFIKHNSNGTEQRRADGTPIYDEDAYRKAIADSEKMAAVTDGLTKIAVLFEDAFRKVTGQFLAGFYNALAPILSGTTGDDFQVAVTSLGHMFNDLGTIMGGFIVTITHVFTTVNGFVSSIKDMLGLGTKDKDGKSTTSSPITAILLIVGGLIAIKAILLRFLSFFTGRALGLGGRAAGFVGGKMKNIHGLGWLGTAAGAAEGALGGIGGGGCCDTLSQGLDRLTDRVDHHGEIAHGHAMDMKGTATKAAKEATEGAEQLELGLTGGKVGKTVATDAATHVVEKAGLKAVGGSLLKRMAKFIPVVGTVMGGIFAGQRALQGDYVGAAGELAGAASSLIPGIGWAADAAIQAGLLAHDIARANPNINPAAGTDSTAQSSTAPNSPPECPTMPTDAYYHNGIATVDSTGSGDTGQADDVTTNQAQLTRLQKMQTDLQAASKDDTDRGDTAKAKIDQDKLTKVLEDIRALTNQQLQLQKNGNQKLAQTVLEKSSYGPMTGW